MPDVTLNHWPPHNERVLSSLIFAERVASPSIPLNDKVGLESSEVASQGEAACPSEKFNRSHSRIVWARYDIATHLVPMSYISPRGSAETPEAGGGVPTARRHDPCDETGRDALEAAVSPHPRLRPPAVRATRCESSNSCIPTDMRA